MALNEDEQTDAVFKSSRTDVDPVSGNEVPPGSLPEEVRDDIPAQLSEGEYVVPADVLRFYGMKFFEDLRKEAKMELARMDAEGRIGGEPMGEMQEGDLTPEEMAEIETMMMAVGGYATQQDTQSTQPDPYQQQQMMYRQGAPVAVGNAGYNQGGEVRGYAPGGDVVPMPNVPEPTTPAPMGTQANIDFSQFGAGFSFSPQAQQNLQQIGQSTQAQPAFTPVTMYAPDGTEVTANTLDEYNSYLSQGYTMAPPAVKPSNDDGPPPTDTEPKDPTSWADGLDFTDSDAVKASVDEMLGLSKGEKTAATVGLAGAALVGLNRATGVARSRALVGMLRIMGDDETANELELKINKTVSDSKFLSLLPNETIDGDRILSQLQSRFGQDAQSILSSLFQQQATSSTVAETAAIQSGGGATGDDDGGPEVITGGGVASRDDPTVIGDKYVFDSDDMTADEEAENDAIFDAIDAQFEAAGVSQSDDEDD
jgi:hypothetical protein